MREINCNLKNLVSRIEFMENLPFKFRSKARAILKSRQIIFYLFILFFCSYPVLLRHYSWLCTEELLGEVLRVQMRYHMLGKALPAVLSLQAPDRAHSRQGLNPEACLGVRQAANSDVSKWNM